MFELEIIHTSCRDCLFAEYEGQTQVGCGFNGRLERFAKDNLVVEAYDQEKEFCLINGRKCTAFRDAAWGAHHKPDEWAGVVRRELTLRFNVVIHFDGNEDHHHDLQKTLDAIRAQVLKPAAVLVLNNQTRIPSSILHVKLRKMAADLPWSLTDIIERQTDGSRVSRERALDITSGRFTGHYYTVFCPGAKPKPSFLLDIDRAVTDRLARFSVILPDAKGDGLTVALGFHNAPRVQGNRPVEVRSSEEGPPEKILGNVVEKAQYFAEVHNLPHLVTTMEALCNLP